MTSKLSGKNGINSSILDSPSFHKQKHSHCLDSLFSPINKKAKLSHWSSELKGKFARERLFKNENILDIENSLLFNEKSNVKHENNVKDRNNNINSSNRNKFDNFDDITNKSSLNGLKKERVKSEPNLFNYSAEEIKKKKLMMPKYNSLLSFEKIPFDSINVKLDELMKDSKNIINRESENNEHLEVKKRKFCNDNEIGNDQSYNNINANKRDKNYNNNNENINQIQNKKEWRAVKKELNHDDDNRFSNYNNKKNNVLIMNRNIQDGKVHYIKNKVQENNKNELDSIDKTLIPNSSNMAVIKNEFSKLSEFSSSSSNFISNKKIKIEYNERKNVSNVNNNLLTTSFLLSSNINIEQRKIKPEPDEVKNTTLNVKIEPSQSSSQNQNHNEKDTKINNTDDDEFGFDDSLFDDLLSNKELDEMVLNLTSKISKDNCNQNDLTVSSRDSEEIVKVR